MNRVVIITGTRKGIGKALCEYFLDNGDFVYGCSRRPGSIKHENYKHYELDVSQEDRVVQMIRSINKVHPKIDILINNAGAASMNHFLLTPYSTVKKLFDTNYFGTFLFCREVSKNMVRHKNGRIINFSTVAVPLNLEGELVYASTKSAVEQLSKTLANELGDFNITVNVIGPTPISTDLIKGVPLNKIEELIQKQNIKRIGNFEDVLNVIKFFICEQSNFVTGQKIYLGGIN